MEPAEGFHKRIDGPSTNSTVCLTRSTRIPARVGAKLKVRPDTPVTADILIFIPDPDWSSSAGLEVEDSLLLVAPDGSLKIPALNTTDVAVNVTMLPCE